MIDEKIFDMFQKLTDQIRQNTDALKTIIANHETRIVVLETKKNDEGWKNQLLMLLAKAAVIGTVAIGSLTGASSLIARIFGL